MSESERAVGSFRERKKAETRARIAAVATMLFLERGFDQVTVAEVAEAAGCSAMTVFNYFPRKEDLFLDRIPEIVAMFEQAALRRGPGVTAVSAVHAMLVEQLQAGHPLVALRDDLAHFWRVVLDSPSLRARAREGVEEVERALADAVAAGGDDPHPRLTAALVVAAYRAVYVTAAGRMLAGEPARTVAPRHRALMDGAFRVLETASSDLGQFE